MKVSKQYKFVQVGVTASEMDQVRNDCTVTDGDSSMYVDLDMYADYAESNALVDAVASSKPNIMLIEFYEE